MLGFNIVSEPLFETLGDKVTGFYNNLGYDVSADTAMNKAFVESSTAKNGSAPYYVAADNYLAAQTLFAAVKKAKSVDPAKVKAAMNGLSFDSIVGQVSMGSDHQLVRPSYVGQIVDIKGQLGWDVIAQADGTTTRPAPDAACKA